MKTTFIDAKEAARLIPDGSTVAIDGFIGFCLAEDILGRIEERFIETGHPRNLSIVNVAGIGGDGKDRGINHFAHKDLVGRLLCSNLSLANKIYPNILANDFPVYMYPQGVLSHMMRAIAGHKPGVITQVGMKTFVDPRVDGGRVNEAARVIGEELVELINLNGEDYLFYPRFDIDIALIKGTIADTQGNISMEREAVHIEPLEMAVAAKNSGGIVMVQVDEVVGEREIHPQRVTVPANFVDYVVKGSPGNTGQHFLEGIDEIVHSWYGGEVISYEEIPPMEPGAKKIICRRAAMEIKPHDFINLGIGTPSGISKVLNEEGVIDDVTLSTESGVTGGVAAGGGAVGAAFNPEAIVKQPDMFDIYDGGGVDLAGLGAAEIDRYGNVNVSKFADKVTGPGGFINISQGSKTVCFLGTFTAGKQDIRIEGDKLNIVQDGKYIKFKNNVEQITFSGPYALEQGRQKILFITERCVFRLSSEKSDGRNKCNLEIVEIAPGVDLERDIFAHMEFEPRVSKDLKEMDSRLFVSGPMGMWKE